MNYLWFIMGIGLTICLLFLRNTYFLGTKKSFQKFLSILIPIILSGTATRIGSLILPDSLNISYYIAGIGTILFYIILAPIIKKEESDRYRKITKESRLLAVVIGLGTSWLFFSLICFFINLFIPGVIPDKIMSVLIIPVRFLWLFPY